jgi:MFS family permease
MPGLPDFDFLTHGRFLFSGGIGVVIGTILQAASVNYGMMIFARIFNGIWNGLLTSVVPTYQAECSKPASRGKLLLFSGSLITFVSPPRSDRFRWVLTTSSRAS